MIKAIIFDVDNTLIDTGNISSKAYIETARELGLKPITKKAVEKLYGVPSKDIIKKFWPKANVEVFQKIKHKKILQHKVKQIPGSKQVIKTLSKKYKLGLLSSKTRVLMYPHLKQINLSSRLFKFIHSADDSKYHKPNPKVFSKAKQKLKLSSSEILYVGDSIHDATAALKANLKFVAVLTGVYKKKDFLKLGLQNKNILKSIKSLPSWLDKND